MIGYVTLGSNDLEKGVKFYDDLIGFMGGKRLFNMDRIYFWAGADGGPMLSLCRPYDEKAATPGNGVMVALAAKSKADVDKFHAHALKLGAKDEGAPGARTDNFYGAYCRDLDGNKLCFFIMG
ncbi:MAG: VOC family protein [Parvibaculum sp.]